MVSGQKKRARTKEQMVQVQISDRAAAVGVVDTFAPSASAAPPLDEIMSCENERMEEVAE